MLTKILLSIIIVLSSSAYSFEGMEEQPPQDLEEKSGVALPMILRCFDYDGSQALKDQFGEIAFVQGNGDIEFSNNKGSVPVEMTLYVNPETKSWTQMYKLGETLHCVSAGGTATFRAAEVLYDGQVKM